MRRTSFVLSMLAGLWWGQTAQAFAECNFGFDIDAESSAFQSMIIDGEQKRGFWRSIKQAPPELRDVARFVGRLQVCMITPDGAPRTIRTARGTGEIPSPFINNCTATLLSDNRLLTNEHCYYHKDLVRAGFNIIQEARIDFLYHSADNPAQVRTYRVLPREMMRNGDLDALLLQVLGTPNQDLGGHFPMQMMTDLQAQQALYMVHHPNGDPQQFSAGTCQIHRLQEEISAAHPPLRHTCESMPGSSGSLLLDARSLAVVGLHNRGGLDRTGDSYNGGNKIGPIETAFQMGFEAVRDDADRDQQAMQEVFAAMLIPDLRQREAELTRIIARYQGGLAVQNAQQALAMLQGQIAAQDQAARDREARDRAEAAREQEAREKAEAERIARDQAEAERIAREKAEAERIARDQAEAERIAREKAEAERIAREKARDEDAAERLAAQAALEAEAERRAIEAERLAILHAEYEAQLAASKAVRDCHSHTLLLFDPPYAPTLDATGRPPVQDRFDFPLPETFGAWGKNFVGQPVADFCRQALVEFPNDPGLRVMLGLALELIGADAEAFDQYSLAQHSHLEGEPEFHLARLYGAGRGVAQSDAERRRFLELSAGLGYRRAQFYLGLDYFTRRDLDREDAEAEAVNMLHIAAERGFAPAQYVMAVLIAEENPAAVKRGGIRQAEQLWQQAAEAGLLVAQMDLAAAYEGGQMLAQDLAKAEIYYEMALNNRYDPAERDLERVRAARAQKARDAAESALGASADPGRHKDVIACDGLARPQNTAGFTLGLPDHGGLAAEEIDSPRAISACERAFAAFPDHADIAALYARALRSDGGRDGEALRFFRLAANGGSALGQHGLGTFYLKGLGGLSVSDARAREFYELAAKQGYAPALSSMGFLYTTGRGVSRNYQTAVSYYTDAVALGNLTAMTNLGWMYETGKGVATSPSNAVALYIQALRGGRAWAADRAGGRWTRATARELQRQLRDLGLYTGAIDGKIGPGSKAAMRRLLPGG